MHVIKLDGYNATVDNGEKLELGTFDSYGEEQLQIVKAPDWGDLSVIATFNPPYKKPVQAVVDSVTGVVKVPKEATADSYGVGTIVFVGLADGIQRISSDVEYIVRRHSNASGTEPAEPTPDLMQQVLTLSKDAQTAAKNAVKDAAASEQAAAQAAEIAQSAAGSLRLYVSQIKDDLAELDQLLPEAAPVAGNVLKVLVVNTDGTFTCEWADGGSGSVRDVKIGNDSVVKDGIASIPVAVSGNNSVRKYGVLTVQTSTQGFVIKDGILSFSEPNVNDFASRSSFKAVTMRNYDTAVKTAMCDGKGTVWNDTERLAALLRMGCTVDENGFIKWTAQEVEE